MSVVVFVVVAVVDDATVSAAAAQIFVVHFKDVTPAFFRFCFIIAFISSYIVVSTTPQFPKHEQFLQISFFFLLYSRHFL